MWKLEKKKKTYDPCTYLALSESSMAERVKHALIEMKSLRGKPRSIMFLGFNSLLSQQAAGNLTQERLKGVGTTLFNV